MKLTYEYNPGGSTPFTSAPCFTNSPYPPPSPESGANPRLKAFIPPSFHRAPTLLERAKQSGYGWKEREDHDESGGEPVGQLSSELQLSFLR